MYTLAYKTKKSNNISSFKIQGNALNFMEITPVEDCVVDFGDGTKQTFTGNNSSTRVNHNYSESNIYTIKITGNHSKFQASRNIIELIQISNSITSCSQMFYNCYNLTTISETCTIPNSVTRCSYMFQNCSSLTTIPSTFTIPNSASSCKSMFYYCSSLTELPSTLKIPNSVTDCAFMFQGCSNLTAIPETFTIGNSVKDCSSMFAYCSRLTTIPSTLKIPNSVTSCGYMFSDCSSLTSDISNIWPDVWNSTEEINLAHMFDSCSKVVGTVPAAKLWNSGKTFNSVFSFYKCTSLTNYDEIPSEWKE